MTSPLSPKSAREVLDKLISIAWRDILLLEERFELEGPDFSRRGDIRQYMASILEITESEESNLAKEAKSLRQLSDEELRAKLEEAMAKEKGQV